MKFQVGSALLLASLLLFPGCQQSPETGSKALSPEASLATFRLPNDLRVEIFAAEPYVRDPVDLVFDEEGRAFVAEMLDYPYDPPSREPPRSRIRALEDRDGDGRVDHSVVFADRILQLKGLLAWNGGIIAAAAPDLLFFKDTDGDLRADERKVLFTGFEVGQPQGRVSNLRFSVDNWIYVSNDGHPGEVSFSQRPNAAAVSVLGSDFRFRLDRGLFESASGAARFGQTLDAWGHRFVTRTGTHSLHVLLPRRYLQRNPFLAAAAPAVQDISDHDASIFPLTPPEEWRKERTTIRQQRSDELGLARQMKISGVFTGATGGTIYGAAALPAHYQGNLFTAGIAGNLVHRDLLRPSGISFVASRPREERNQEFLASADPWFRPVQFKTGWDGNLYMVDIYRQLVEDPESIPEPIKKHLDFYAGTELGRIYRIVPKEEKAIQSPPSLGQSSNQNLVGLLSHPNQWWRLTAQRLLIQRQDQSLVPLLEELVRKGDSAAGRLHALYSLEALQALSARILETVLRDPHPALQEHAVGLAERFPQLLDQLVVLTERAEARVAFQLALSLGEFDQNKVYRALAILAQSQALEPGFRTAILSSEAGSSLKFLSLLLQDASFFKSPMPQRVEFFKELSAVVSARNLAGEIARLLDLLSRSSQLSQEAWQAAGLAGMVQGLQLGQFRGLDDPTAIASIRHLLSSSLPPVQELASRVAQHFRMPALWALAERQALDSALAITQRVQAIRTLAAAPLQVSRPTVERLLDSHPAPELRTALFRTLARFDEPEVADLILSRWKTLSPGDRSIAIEVLLAHGQRVSLLLDALDGGEVEPAALEQGHRVILIQHPDQEIRRRALKFFKRTPGERDEVVRRYQKVLELDGEAKPGQAVFERECSQCHRPQPGGQVGPDLQVGVQGHTRPQLIQAILDPSAEILGMFQNYIVSTRDGRVYGGVLAAETPGALTLRSGPGEQQTILRARIVEIRASEVSLMPDGLEDNISIQEMTDLIAFIQAGYLLSSNPSELKKTAE